MFLFCSRQHQWRGPGAGSVQAGAAGSVQAGGAAGAAVGAAAAQGAASRLSCGHLNANRTGSAEMSWKPAVRESRAVFSVRCSSLSAAGPFLPRLVHWGGWICGNERCQEVEGERTAWPLLFLQSHIISLIFFG